MKNVIIFSFLILLLVALPAMAADTITDWATGRADIAWAATPTNYQESVTTGDSVLWVGPIEETNVYFDDQDEIVIEFLCRNLSLDDSSPGVIGDPIQVKDMSTGYFVVSIRAPSLPVEQAHKYCADAKETTHYVAVLGVPVGPSSSFGETAIYVQSEKTLMSDKLQVDIKE